ncbi:IS3 family transposase [Streptomyces mirabilis]|uniref:IS3 family transposase n=1 Tax=Streptomyces mirabilis TaxID=68239 RepID=UPI0033EFFC41
MRVLGVHPARSGLRPAALDGFHRGRCGQRDEESFWARVQVEPLNRRRWRTRLELSTALFEYLEIFHNRQRRHSALGMVTPVEYELRPPPVARNQATRPHPTRDSPEPPPIQERFTPWITSSAGGCS